MKPLSCGTCVQERPDSGHHHGGAAIRIPSGRIGGGGDRFAWPGLGRYMIEAVSVRDYPVLQALLLLYSFHFVFINLLVDMVYALINPEIRYE